ncbi:MAG: hypothetical protein AUJ81_07800 [Helicobacteraceae bacterium CG1_02_36_14]|nr:MAG: hypothetical protein AUJ81_07800 [Helicobacteraceae bacterium CG1_02_36_14]
MKTKKVHHNKRKCIGCGGCALVAKTHFEMDKTDGKAKLKNPISQNEQEIYTSILFEEELEKNKTAAKLCPVNAIRIEED